MVTRATQADPATRFGSVRELLEAFQAVNQVKAQPLPDSYSTEGFEKLINEFVLEWLPSAEPLSKLTLKFLARQAALAGLPHENLETELTDFRELYREATQTGALTPFKRRSLLVQGEAMRISSQTIDQLLERATGSRPQPKPTAPVKEEIPVREERILVPAAPDLQSGYAPAPARFPQMYFARAVGLFEGFDEDKLLKTSAPDSLFEITAASASEATFRITGNAPAQERSFGQQAVLPAGGL